MKLVADDEKDVVGEDHRDGAELAAMKLVADDEKDTKDGARGSVSYTAPQ